MNMSFAELFNTLFFAAIGLLAWLIPLPLKRRIIASAIGAFGLAVCFFLASSSAFLPEQAGRQLRAWAPLLLILIAYHQSGRLFNKPWKKFEAFLMGLDRKLLGRFGRDPGAAKIHSVFSGYLEVSYLACYALVPAAVGILFMMGLQDRIEKFWLAVLPSTYACYALIPLFPAFPPRLLDANRVTRADPGRVRVLNLWILRHGSIQANTFPSAHVAACTAASVFVLQHNGWIGAAFLWISFSIAAAVVIRRYHYLMDAVLGVVMPFVFFAFVKS